MAKITSILKWIWAFMAKKDIGNVFATVSFLLLAIFGDSILFFILAVIMFLFCIRDAKS